MLTANNRTTRLVERADVLAVEEVVVGELEEEVDEEAAPDHDVVEDRPVGRVQRDLGVQINGHFWDISKPVHRQVLEF